MSHPARLHLNKGVRHRILTGHPWVFASEVEKIAGDATDGETVAIVSPQGEFLGSAIYNARSQIVARRYAREDVALDEALLSARLDQALAYRRELDPQAEAQRLVWSESDRLPGLIVDHYADVLVVQTLTLALSRREKIIADLLLKKTDCCVILARNDAPVRQLEGLPLTREVLHGEYQAPTPVTISGIRYELDLWSGQKTGFYLDQVENYGAVASFAPGRRVLDCFTNQGAFALSAMRAGAISCEAIDQSGEALALAATTAKRAGLEIAWRQGNVFDLLRQYEQSRATFDLIILDPPSFTKSKGNKDAALRGYHDLHVRALRLLAPDGILATFSCSHHVTAADWLGLLERAAGDAHASLRLRRRLGQSGDHPVLVNVPETEYLRGYVVQKVRGGAA
jgi:23S rRNA (cytosine1962-C5)-methyltransferase